MRVPRTTGPSPRRTARSRAQAPARGSVLVEALVFMALLLTVFAYFTTSAVSAGRVQSYHHHTDIASQAAHGHLERAKTITWDNLGFLATDPGYDPLPGPDGQPTTVTLPAEPAGERLRPVETVTVKGLPVTLTTAITWDSAPAAGDHRVKSVTVTASWQEPTGTQQVTQTAARSTTANDAAVLTGPDAIDVGFGDPLPAATRTTTPPPSSPAPDTDFTWE